MKNIKFIYLLLVAVGAMAFTACNKTEWTPGEADVTLGVYFPNDVVTTYQVESTETAITLPLMRSKSEEDAVATIRANDESGLFDVQATVPFAKGETEATLLIKFDGKELVAGTTYNILLQISGECASKYGYSEITIKVRVPEPWNDLGQGIYIDDFLRVLLEDVPAGYGAYVPMQQHAENPNRIRVVNPFSMDVVGYMWGGVPGFFVWDDEEDVYFEFDVTDPDNVLMPENPAYLGVKANFGEDGILPLYLYVVETEEGGYAAPITYKDGIITFPANNIVLAYPYEGGLQGWEANSEGMTQYMMPGVEITDYTLIAEYAGMIVSADNKTSSAIINFTVGADVESFKFIVVSGAVEDLDAVVASINDGTAENINEGDAENSTFEIALETGTYTIVAVPYSEGAPVGDVATTFFYYPGLGGNGGGEEKPKVEAEFVVDALENLVSEEQKEEIAKSYPAEYYMGILLNIPNPQEVTGMRFYYDSVEYVHAAIEDGSKVKSYEDVVDNYGDDVYAWIEGIEDGNIRILRALAGTNYCFIFAIDTVYGETQYYHVDYQMPAYSGAFAIGKYTMTEGEFSTTLNITPSIQPGAVFVEFADIPGFSFYGIYDEDMTTLSLDGMAYGYESYKTLFQMGLPINEDGSYQVLVCSDSAEFDKAAKALVFGLTDNAPSSLKNYFKKFRAVEDGNSLEFDSEYYTFTPAAVIAPVAAPASCSLYSGAELKSMPVASESLKVEVARKTYSATEYNGDFERTFVMTGKFAMPF